MTQKDLDYIEQTLEHICNIEIVCNSIINETQNKELKKLLLDLKKKHQNSFKCLYDLQKDKS